MSNIDPYELLFGGMEKLGPGSNDETLKVLDSLPEKDLQLVVDAGCGTGRQTLILAEALKTKIHALETFETFLKDLSNRAKKRKLDHLIIPQQMDMADIPKNFKDIDLLWSEGSAYSIGFDKALKEWSKAIKVGGFLVVSELSWVSDQAPKGVREFFKSEYPGIRTFQENIQMIKKLGYKLIETYQLSRKSWIDGFYEVLEPRAKTLLSHESDEVRTLATEMLKEIDVFKNSEDSYAYYFFILQR